MLRPFRKMHGLGNDFVVFDARAEPLALSGEQVRGIADRHTGIGCDQLIVLEAAPDADASMRIWNADGGEVTACGNAARAVATLLGPHAVIATASGRLDAIATAGAATILYPPPRFEWDAVPLAYALDTADMPVGWEELERPGALSVGNPHLVFFVPDTDAVDLGRLGPLIEHDPLFPERINVGVAQVVARDRLRLRVWERGVGLTRACGTGAMAAVIAAARRGFADRRAAVELPGGELLIDWRADGRIALSGPAVTAFTGEVEL